MYRGGFNPPPPQIIWSFDKAEPNSQFRGKYIRNNLVRIRVSLICKLSGNPWLGVYSPQIPVLSAMLSTEFVEPPLKKKSLGTPLQGVIWGHIWIYPSSRVLEVVTLHNLAIPERCSNRYPKYCAPFLTVWLVTPQKIQKCEWEKCYNIQCKLVATKMFQNNCGTLIFLPMVEDISHEA
jgi:hypothetical protein